MASETTILDKTHTEVVITEVANGTQLLHSPDLVGIERLAFQLRVAYACFSRNASVYIASLFQTLEGKSRIYEKSYTSHPHLKHRFIPPLEKSESRNVLPPLFLDIHGGGFIMGDPWNDDEPNLCISTNLDCLVVSMNYSKAPAVQFPTPTNELVDTVLEILADKYLRFDRSRVVIGGYSAGGNLCLSVAQSPLLRDKLQGVISWYPATDFTIHPDVKARSRPYNAASSVDMLRGDYDIFPRAYTASDTFLDPRLSVGFTPRQNLPKHLLIVGAEYDLICKEAAVMAGNYAGLDVEGLWDKNLDKKFGFEAEGIKWICVRGALHGFTHTIGNFGSDGRKKTEVSKQHYTEVCEWLSKGPFSSRTE